MLGVDRFTTSAQEVALRAAEIMQRYNHHQIDTEILLLALIEQPQGGISQILKFLKVDPNALTAELDTILRNGPKGDPVEVGPEQVAITPRVAQILGLANQQAIQQQDEQISTEHIFLEIFSEHETPAVQLLEGAGLTRERVYDAIQQLRG